jgi:hypothetical protein
MATQISADSLMRTISYYYLLTFCPPEFIGDLKEASEPMLKSLAEQAGMVMENFTSTAIPEAARHIVAFHQVTREPDEETVEALIGKTFQADRNPENASAFQTLMSEIAEHPGRAKADNRLHRKKGCRFCETPCRYGYFTLVSDPDFRGLQVMLDAENKKPPGERDPINVLWTFTTGHLWQVLGTREAYIRADHLGNLSYCLLMLATAKSRFALPEKQLITFQEMNQRTIRNWRPT